MFEKNSQISNFMHILPVRFNLFRAERRKNRRTNMQTWQTKLIVSLGNFAEMPKIYTPFY